MAFSIKKSVVATPSFSERIASIKSPCRNRIRDYKGGISNYCIAGRHQNY